MIRFFVSGYNKSGTTYLQMLLDGHPAIHCPSEQYFNLILHVAEQLSTEYEKQIALFDKNTANQGIRFDRSKFFAGIVQGAILAQMETGINAQTTHVGLNDNSMVDNWPFWSQMFPQAHFVFIVRDPRALAVSIWHHRVRTEPEFVKSGATIGAVANAMATSWPKHVDKLLEFRSAHPDRVLTVRFEDLIGADRKRHLEQVLARLGTTMEEALLDGMLQRVDFDTLRKKEKRSLKGRSGFYRQGNNEGWEAALTPDTGEKFIREGGRQMMEFGYLPQAPA